MDYKARVRKLQPYLKKSGLSAFLILTKTNRTYLSGFTGSKGYLLVSGTSAKLFVDDRYTIRAKKESPLSVLHISKLSTSPGLRSPSPRQGRVKLKVGVEDSIHLREFLDLKRQIKGVNWVVTSNAIENIRAIKSEKEISYIKKGSQIIDATFRHVQKLVKKNFRKGITEIELAQEIEKFGKKQGADGLAFDPIVAFGSNAAAPHHFSSNRKIGKNNFLLLDFGILVKGYHSDFTRTLFVGKPTKVQEKVYNIVLAAQLMAVERVKRGSRASVVDKAARKFIDDQGYGEKFTHNTGHGVGLKIHELPNFSPDSTDVLKENMVVTVEPGIYLEKKFGVRIEDMVRVRKQGPEVLSKIPKEFKEMVIN